MISIHHLQFGYGKKKVFDNLTLELLPGHIYGLLGKNGTGKSTLLRSIAGLLQPDGGKIEVLGYEPFKRKPSFLQHIFMIPEEIDLPQVNISDYTRSNSVFYPAFSNEQFNTYLEEFDVPVNNRLDQMSYGQKKKFLISFGLACNPTILLMDEPTNGLDITSKGQFRKVLAGAVDHKKIIVISTHQVRDLENLIDQITIIDEGRILFNQHITAISNRLSFSYATEHDNDSDAFYTERSLNGKIMLLANTEGDESKPDFEILYKAILKNAANVNSIFK